jgi:amidohydrolase
VIPTEVTVQGTIRTFEPEVRALVIQRFTQVVEEITSAMECQAEIEIKPLTPAVFNAPAIASKVQATATQLFHEDKIDVNFRTMVSEDMAFIMQEIPGCYFLVGSANPAQGLIYGHHHPRFDFDEQALPKAAALMAASIETLMR